MTATAINTQEPPGARLTQGGGGLGVRADRSLTETNQINNLGDDEAVIFDFGKAVAFDSITLGRLALIPDAWAIYGTDADLTGVTSGGLASLTTGSTLLSAGASNAHSETISLSGTFRYLIATVPAGGSFVAGDGYTVRSLTVSSVPTPLGAGLLLGAFALAGLVRRNRAA
ncbi:MAG: hypothetical protein AAF192_22720 [Pseudomonadota bacterium]